MRMKHASYEKNVQRFVDQTRQSEEMLVLASPDEDRLFTRLKCTEQYFDDVGM